MRNRKESDEPNRAKRNRSRQITQDEKAPKKQRKSVFPKRNRKILLPPMETCKHRQTNEKGYTQSTKLAKSKEGANTPKKQAKSILLKQGPSEMRTSSRFSSRRKKKKSVQFSSPIMKLDQHTMIEQPCQSRFLSKENLSDDDSVEVIDVVDLTVDTIDLWKY